MRLEPIMIEMEVMAPVDHVWRAWVEPGELTMWLAEQANVRAEVGGEYELFWEPDHPQRNSTQGCTITAIRSNDMLSFTWKGPEPYAHLMNNTPPATSVTLTLRAAGPDLTSVQLEHRGWGVGPHWIEARAWQERAWRDALGRLRQWVEEQFSIG